MNRIEVTQMNTLIKSLNTKSVYVVMIPCEITDRRTDCTVSDYLFEIVAKHEDYEINVAVERLKMKADKLGADIEILDYENIEWASVDIHNDSLYDTGVKE